MLRQNPWGTSQGDSARARRGEPGSTPIPEVEDVVASEPLRGTPFIGRDEEGELLKLWLDGRLTSIARAVSAVACVAHPAAPRLEAPVRGAAAL
jgi:hypothetical protein